MALLVSDLEYEHREVLLRDKPEQMLAASPKGTVPVFVHHDGAVIDESFDLMLWSLRQSDPSGWMNCDMGEARGLIKDNDGPFKHHLDRYKYASRYKDDAKRGDVDLSHREKAEVYLCRLEDRLSAKPFLLGHTQSIADIAIFPFIRQFANTDRDWWTGSPFKKLEDWLARHISSDLFQAIMKKYPVWQEKT